MNFKKITNSFEAEQMYQEHIAVDFPPFERPPLPFFMQMIKDSASELYLYEKDGQDIAYAVFHEEDGYILMNFFAVYKNQRGKGIGSELLQAFNSFYADKKGILIEAEHTDYAEDQTDAVVRKKRVAFYERSGYVCLENFDLLLFGVHYHVCVKPLGEDKTGDQAYLYDVICRMYSAIPREFSAGAVQWIRQSF